MSQLVITKALSKNGELLMSLCLSQVKSCVEYAGKQAHAELAERMKQRDAGTFGLALYIVWPDFVI
jgi:hypothetical protein